MLDETTSAGRSGAAPEISQARALLREWLGWPVPKFKTNERVGELKIDLLVEQEGRQFVIERKGSSEAAIVRNAAVEVQSRARAIGKRAVPVVVVPFMGDVGKRLCAEADVAWFDLSGNARIVAPGLRIIVEGKPNRFIRRGRPSSAFAPKSARVVRRLLIEPRRSFRQQELAEATGLDDGFTSRIVHRLEADGLLDRDSAGAVRVRDPDLLLDAWSEVYDFNKHTIVRGHVTAKNGDEVLGRLGKAFESRKIQHAATGLSAAWLHTAFAGFRLTTFYVREPPSRAVLKEIGFREEPKGANVWLVVPKDEGVFDGTAKKDGLVCVHPVQAYLDLAAHPERSKEAADELRTRLLRWKS